MVAQNTVRTYGINQAFRFVEGFSLHLKRSQTHFFMKRPILLHTCAEAKTAGSLVGCTCNLVGLC